MNKLYMGIDVGSLYIKGVVIDEYNNIISSYYDKMHGNAIDSVKKMLIKIKQDIDEFQRLIMVERIRKIT